MYRCDECGEVFEEVGKLYEDTGEVFDVSPCCKGTYEEAEECECGEYIEKGEKFCDKCKMQIQKRFQEFMDTFTAEEREYLNEVYDGEEF